MNVPNAPIEPLHEATAAPRDCKHGRLARKCEICDLEAEEHILRYGGIIEVAVRNQNVAEYMAHWEGRAEKAEAALKALALESESEPTKEQLRLQVEAARSLINAAVEMMTTDQVGNWTGVRSWLEQDATEYLPQPAAEYARKNPLGGPANVFYAMADRIRAGEDYWHVLDDYGFTTLDGKPEILAEHEGEKNRREWHQAGAWLMPGERIIVQRAEKGAT